MRLSSDNHCYSYNYWYFFLCRLESQIIIYGGLIRAGIICYDVGISTIIISAIIFMTFGGIGGMLTPRTVFEILSLITFLRRTIENFDRSLINLYEASVAVTRMKVCLILVKQKFIDCMGIVCMSISVKITVMVFICM